MIKNLLELTVWIIAVIILSWTITEPPPGGFDRSVHYPSPSKIVKLTPVWFHLDKGWRSGRTRVIFENGEWNYE